jgi:hypothetical protein
MKRVIVLAIPLLAIVACAAGGAGSNDQNPAAEGGDAGTGGDADAGFDADAAAGDGMQSTPGDGSTDAAAGPTPPRPIAPLSTSRVTSRRPTLRWALPEGVSDATLDVCLDRACTKPIGAPVHVTGTSYVPASDLPTGVVYWRLHPSTMTAVTSPTWQFAVGPRSATVDASWGTTLDVDGDGYADFAVGAPGASGNTGSVSIYPGSAKGVATTPAVVLIGPDGIGGDFGYSVASAGDVNGDGYADLVVGAYAVSSYTGRAYVYLGSATGLVAPPAVTLTGPGGNLDDFGSSVASAGDVNGDGYADLVVGADGASGGMGSAYVYLGSATGVAAAPTATLTNPDGMSDSFGDSVASAGDVNGDGYADVIVGAYGVSGETGAAYLFVGGKAGLATTPATTVDGYQTGSDFGASVAGAGDVDGDGYSDLVFGAPKGQEIFVYPGSAKGLVTKPPVGLLYGPNGGEWNFGASVASAGDVNGDGYADILVGASMGGSAFVYLGSAAGFTPMTGQLPPSPAAALVGADGVTVQFGASVASAGDVNGDGYADVLVGAPSAGPGGAVHVYLGNASGVTDPGVTLTGSANANEQFGAAVSGASN